jgi:hypothetical protein
MLAVRTAIAVLALVELGLGGLRIGMRNDPRRIWLDAAAGDRDGEREG